ncbi:MAG: Putative preQ0 transporter YhhQ, partial [uncultured Rubrobacteraceae bacterium]
RPRLARLRLPGLRRKYSPYGHNLRYRRPMARQICLRSPRHTANVRSRQPPQAHRGSRRLRPRYPVQPSVGQGI